MCITNKKKMTTAPNFEIIVGTYEEYLLGYTTSIKDTGLELTQTFANHAHSSSIRCVTSGGKYLASGSADDRIVVYDMKSRKEHCMLTQHNSTITCLEFTPLQTHIISGSSDGVLSIVRVGNWQLEKIWDKAHKGSNIIDLAVHSTGKIALTLGADMVLRTWNLIKGRLAYAINLKTKSVDAKSLDSIQWCPDDERFVLSGGINVEIWNTSTGGIVNKFQYKSKVICTAWLTENKLAIGHEDGTITLLNVKKEKTKTYPAHKMRVKCLQFSENYLISTSSDGHIKIWEFNGKSIEEKANCSTGCRCTSLTLVKNVKSEIKKVEETTTNEEINTIEYTDINKGCKIIIEDESETPKRKKQKKTKNKKMKVDSENSD